MSAVPPPLVGTPAGTQAPIPNHLAWAIISTVLATCLCCPLGLIGIVAIVFAAKVNGLLNQGDIDARAGPRPMPRPGAGWPLPSPSSAC